MGRETKRVDLRFDWFERTKDNADWRTKIWPGYVMDEVPCILCNLQTGRNSRDETCPLCYGEGKVSPRIEPPDGEGWQLWEDVSEGSPVSPVFKTAKGLASWLAKNHKMCGMYHSKEEWLATIKAGSVPSGGFFGGRVLTGAQMAGGK